MYVRKLSMAERVMRMLMKPVLMLIVGIFGLIAMAIPGGMALLFFGVVLQGIGIIQRAHELSSQVMEGGLMVFSAGFGIIFVGATIVVLYKVLEAEYGLLVNKNQ
jgi:hypothetical protein